MRRGELFWGGLLVILGVLFFLQAAGYLTGDVFGWFWPIFIILLGIWVLSGGYARRSRFAAAGKFSIPLQGATEATLAIDHGAGRMLLRSDANPGDFLTGVMAAGMNHSEWHDGDKLLVRLEAGPSLIPVLGPEDGIWEFRLNRDVPIALSIHSGASSLDLDLTDLHVTSLAFDGGASRLNLSLPARVQKAVANIRAAAAQIEMQVPAGVALRFRANGVGRLVIDETRFPRSEEGSYQSADYASAQYHADVTVDGGASSVRIY